MIIEMLKRSMLGIAFGGINTFIALTIMKFFNIEATVSEIWLHTLCGLLLGIYFGLGSFVFESNVWSPLKKTVIHFSLSITVYFLIAIPVGWIPFNLLSIILGIFAFAFFYILFWIGFLIYSKKIEHSMNEQLQKRE